MFITRTVRAGKALEIFEEPHTGYTRHYVAIIDPDKDKLTANLKAKLRPNVVNGIKIPETILWLLQEIYLERFPRYKLRITQRVVEDVNNEERKCQLIMNEHKRAHRNARENKEQLLE